MLQTVFLSAVLAASPAGGACTELPQVGWAVAALHGVVAEDTSLPLNAIQEMARQRGGAPAHRPLGFYVGSFAHDLDIRTERRTSPDGSR